MPTYIAALAATLITTLLALPGWAAVDWCPSSPTTATATDSAMTIVDDGNFITVESTTIKVVFSYNPAGTGWFTGTGTGGGGMGGSIIGLYYKPTSTTRNMVFRNSAWGSDFDHLTWWQAEGESVDQADFEAPDFGSGRHATTLSHSAQEVGGRVIVTFQIEFEAWLIERTYYIYPWGDITQYANIRMADSGTYMYLSNRIGLAVSLYTITTSHGTFNWGTNYEDDGEKYIAYTDGYTSNNTSYDTYEVVITDSVNANTEAISEGYDDRYSGFMLDDADSDDPDVIVMTGHSSIQDAPYKLLADELGGGPYIETGIYEKSWHADKAIEAGMTYFVNSATCCPIDLTCPGEWDNGLREWGELHHILLRTDTDLNDYTRIWRMRSANIDQMAPTVYRNSVASLDSRDGLYHVWLQEPSGDAYFTVPNPEAIAATHSYVSQIVIENLTSTSIVEVKGPVGTSATLYRSTGTEGALLVISQTQPTAATDYHVLIAP